MAALQLGKSKCEGCVPRRQRANCPGIPDPFLGLLSVYSGELSLQKPSSVRSSPVYSVGALSGELTDSLLGLACASGAGQSKVQVSTWPTGESVSEATAVLPWVAQEPPGPRACSPWETEVLSGLKQSWKSLRTKCVKTGICLIAVNRCVIKECVCGSHARRSVCERKKVWVCDVIKTH